MTITQSNYTAQILSISAWCTSIKIRCMPGGWKRQNITGIAYAGGKGLLDISVIDIAPTIGYVHLGDLS